MNAPFAMNTQWTQSSTRVATCACATPVACASRRPCTPAAPSAVAPSRTSSRPTAAPSPLRSPTCTPTSADCSPAPAEDKADRAPSFYGLQALPPFPLNMGSQGPRRFGLRGSQAGRWGHKKFIMRGGERGTPLSLSSLPRFLHAEGPK